jgi:hypothetical protein
LERVLLALDLNTENVRKAFLDEYGFAHGDPQVDRELERLFRDALCYDPPRSKAEVPLYLLLALVLRRRRGNPKSMTLNERRARGKLLAALRKKARLRKPGLNESATDALWRVAKVGARISKVSTDTMKRWLDSKPRPRR